MVNGARRSAPDRPPDCGPLPRSGQHVPAIPSRELPGPGRGPDDPVRGRLMALALNIGKCTLLGNYRENNEDAIEAKQFPDMTVCIVADGMGGQAAGEIASKRAIEVVPRELRKNLTQATAGDQAKTVIRRAVVQANEEIMAMGQLDRDLRNMGTTVVMAVRR